MKGLINGESCQGNSSLPEAQIATETGYELDQLTAFQLNNEISNNVVQMLLAADEIVS